MIDRIAKRVLTKIFGSEMPVFKTYRNLFQGKTGLEIGGPSEIFSRKNILPVYELATRVDGCNFSTSTVWEGSIKEGMTYVYDKGKGAGQQYISEGNQLDYISDASYDFVLSSHSLEHFANPLKAVSEWVRILKPGGVVLIVVPDKRYTFDHKREVTPFSHLLNNYHGNIAESDLTSLDEILLLHDLSMDKPAGDIASFKARSLNNFENRCLHHHVFDQQLLIDIFEYFKLEILFTDFALPYHTIIMGRKR